jgi:cob(I)alamin adenosyltransferase
VPKHHVRVEAFGSVDELNAVLGWALTQIDDSEIRTRLEILQHDLFSIGAHLATPPAAQGRPQPATPPLPQARIAEMERWIDEADEMLPPLRAFVLPGGPAGSAALHVARTVCRRAERAVVHLRAEGDADGTIVAYLNRLSDLLFTHARLVGHRAGVGDREWVKSDPGG